MFSDLQQWAVLYVPVCVALLLPLIWKVYPRLWVAIILQTFWQFASLPWLNYLAVQLGFWKFSPTSIHILGLPLHYYFAWVVWWGIVATITLGKLPLVFSRWWILAAAFLIDLAIMPLLQPQLSLGPYWILGETLLIIGCLLPGLWLAHWTLSWSKVCWRSFLVSITFGILVFTIFPFIAGHEVKHITASLTKWSLWQHYLFLGGMCLASVPAVAGVVIFAKLGHGTPIPFDPPRNLVTSGVYSYIRNPIQWSIIACLILWGFYLQLPLYWGIAFISLCYCMGIAKWSESKDLEDRYTQQWLDYKNANPNWKFNLLPNLDQHAELYVALDCGSCSPIATWIQSKNCSKLSIIDANNWDETPLKRITYVYPCGTTAQGVEAIAAALQHLHIGWAYIGWLISYPGIQQLMQWSMDSAGSSTRDA
ncbi:MAG: hypothetical protein ABGY95_10580 [Rubritalea sp.]|uniref:methyltransferase family protein n=1 Tax=Rubritalea sp. TaxID=2109375 RepID=UPI003242ABEC